MSRVSSIPASSLSAMIWGGRGWHVIRRAERYTAAVAWMGSSAEGRIVAKEKRKKVGASTNFFSAVLTARREGCVPTKCQPGRRGRRPVTRLCALPKPPRKPLVAVRWRFILGHNDTQNNKIVKKKNIVRNSREQPNSGARRLMRRKATCALGNRPRVVCVAGGDSTAASSVRLPHCPLSCRASHSPAGHVVETRGAGKFQNP